MDLTCAQTHYPLYWKLVLTKRIFFNNHSFLLRLLSWLKNSVKYIDIINFLSFTCKFIIHNAFLSPLLLNNWLSVQTKFRIKSVTRQPLGVENPYSSDIVEFSANPAVCRWVKTCHLSWWRHEFYALRQGDTWPERKRNVGSPTLLLQKLGREMLRVVWRDIESYKQEEFHNKRTIRQR